MPCHEKLVVQVNVVGYLLQAGHSPLGSQGCQTGKECVNHSSGRSVPCTKKLVLVECATRGREKDHINGINSVPFSQLY